MSDPDQTFETTELRQLKASDPKPESLGLN